MGAANGVGFPAEAAGNRRGVGRTEGDAAVPQTGDAPRGRSPTGADEAARSTAGATGSRWSGRATREKRPRPSEGQVVEPQCATHHQWYRVGSIASESDALRAHLLAAAVNLLAASGGAPAGAVGLSIIPVLRNGVDRLHASPRTFSDRTMGERMDGVVKIVKKLRRASHMKDDIGHILTCWGAADSAAFADKQFVYKDSDDSGGSRPTDPRWRHR